jgi:hypothetical protein
MDKLGAWALNQLIALDQAFNALLGGDPDETLSSRAGKAKKDNKRWGCVLCGFLDWFDDGHCEKSVEADEGKNAATVASKIMRPGD